MKSLLNIDYEYYIIIYQFMEFFNLNQNHLLSLDFALFVFHLPRYFPGKFWLKAKAKLDFHPQVLSGFLPCLMNFPPYLMNLGLEEVQAFYDKA